MSNLHATYSPSAAERWVNCPASIRLSQGIPPSPDSAASIRGTNTHALLERLLLGLPLTKPFMRSIDYDIGMEENAVTAADVVCYWKEQTHNSDNVTFEVEGKSDLSHIVDADMWGTSDVIIAEEFGTLHVMDYKNGVKKVDAKENYQGLAYILGVADRFDYNFESYRFSIIQPNVAKPFSTWTFGQKRLDLQKEIFRSAVALTKKKSAPMKEGSWCWFCPASASCPKKTGKHHEKAISIFNKGRRQLNG